MTEKTAATSDSKNASKQPEMSVPGSRYSLALIITSAFICIVILFMIVLGLSSYRIDSFQSLLAHITEDSFPEMAYSRNIDNHANELLYFSSHLASSNNRSGLRITKGQIDSKIDNIQKQIIEKNNNVHQLTQLDVIRGELSDLYTLVKQKQVIQEQIQMGQDNLYTLHDKMFKLSQQVTNDSSNQLPSTNWTLAFSEIITLTSKTMIKNRLQAVRQTLRMVDNKINWLNENITLLPPEKQNNAKLLTAELEQILLHENGLLLIKIKQLRVSSRVIGRDNFIKNLIGDFLRVTEFRSFKRNRELLDETHSLVVRGESEEKLINIASLLVLFVLVFVITFIEKRFVGRVVMLNKSVMARLKGDDVKLDFSGNDEISDMANAFNFFADKVEDQKQKLEELSLTDSLTGLANRRALDKRLVDELQNATRHQWPMAIMLMDIDCFKKFNDLYGHIAGDNCLKEVSGALAHCQKRSTDFVARYGGEEFLFILPNTEISGAKKVADNILAEVNALAIAHEESDVAKHVTLSIGIAVFHAEDKLDCEKLLENADHALYKAKLSGKNCRVC